jgi:hypothetical protein
MKKTSRRSGRRSADDLQPEYRLDYSKSRPNRFAREFAEGAVAVVLDPDVARVFDSSEAVNRLLRSVISAMSTKRERAG